MITKNNDKKNAPIVVNKNNNQAKTIDKKTTDKNKNYKTLISIIIVFFVLSFIAIGTGYWAYSVYKKITSYGLQFKSLQNRVDQLSYDVKKQNKDDAINSIQVKSDKIYDEFKRFRKSSQNTLSAITSKLQETKENAKYDKITYLLNLANTKLLLSPTANVSINALQMADNMINELSDPVFLGISDDIQLNINKLKQTNKTNFSALLKDLQNIKRDYNLSLKYYNKQTTSTNATTKQEQLNWMDKIKNKIKQLITIKTIAGKDATHTDTKSQTYLQINRASDAIIRLDEEEFKSSLKDLMEFLDKDKNASLIQKIQKIQKNNFYPKWPDISSSVILFNQIIKQVKNYSNDRQEEADQSIKNKTPAKIDEILTPDEIIPRK
ncbi:MAG: hypothetical protein DRQ51_08200 [Gammaproteobacteria bacterium]|nr:MAG: hypothetical protein DRQ51_08200 [Gammaproteobacteria bacterium]